MTTSWSRWTLAVGIAAAVTMASGTVQAAENEPAGDAARSRANAEVATPTHHQTQLIKVNDGERSATQLNSFAITPDGRILAGCGTKEHGEVRVFDAEGNYVETWPAPVRVEAIGVRAADGVVFIAGNGRLVKLDPEGAVLADEPSPHAKVNKEAAAKIREQVIQQAKRMATTWERQVSVTDQQLQRAEKTVEELQAKLEEFADDDEESRSETEAEIKKFQNRVAALERNRDLWKERVAAIKNTEPSEEQIQKQIDAQIASKMAVASISAVGDTVYVACSDTVGYGYGVWKVDDKFQAGEQIVSGLRGCCGQMDVQACESGIYVAENARHRVACFDTSGKETTSWGGSAADGAEGFSSCCNPMNVAFGQDGSVFTAESTSGRIKQYSPEGKLQQVIGTVDLVPGCKKVSIGVGQEGQRVYMLDITRHHIVVMEPIPTSDREAMIKEAMEPEAPEADEDETAEATASIAPAGRATGVQARRIGQLRRVAPAASTEAASEPQE